MEFEFGETRESEAFFDRNPKFMPVFERLMRLGNLCFGRQMKPKNRAEDVCFGLRTRLSTGFPRSGLPRRERLWQRLFKDN